MTKKSVLTQKERESFCQLQRLINEANSLSASEWIPVNGSGSSRLADYRHNLTNLQKMFFESVVNRFPDYSDFEFTQNKTDIVANCTLMSMTGMTGMTLEQIIEKTKDSPYVRLRDIPVGGKALVECSYQGFMTTRLVTRVSNVIKKAPQTQLDCVEVFDDGRYFLICASNSAIDCTLIEENQ